MRDISRRLLAATGAVALAMSLLLVSTVQPAASAGGGGVEVWAARFHPPHTRNLGNALVVSPDGSRVFVTGWSRRIPSERLDYATAAYDAFTGVKLWSARYGGPLNDSGATSIAVSPDSATVFVTGLSVGPTTGGATIAYDAASGAARWIARSAGTDFSIAASPDGSAVYVTGWTTGRSDYVTQAYDAATGDTLWRSRLVRRADTNQAYSVAVSRDGSTVLVTGVSYRTGHADVMTAAYDGATGARRWVATRALMWGWDSTRSEVRRRWPFPQTDLRRS